MILLSSRLWVIILLWVRAVNLQMPMPPFMPAMLTPMMPTMFYPPPPPPQPTQSPIAFQIMQLQETKGQDGKPEKEEKTVGVAIPMSYPAPMQFDLPAPSAPLAAPFPPVSPRNPFYIMSPGSQFSSLPNRGQFQLPSPFNRPPPDPYFGAGPFRPPPDGIYQSPPVGPLRSPPGGTYGSPFEQYGPPPLGFFAYCKQRPKPPDCPREKQHRSRDQRMPRRRLWREKSYENADSSSSKEWISRSRRKMTGRDVKQPSHNDEEFAKPVLSYITDNGEIKLEEPLSDDEATELMEEQDQNYQKQRVEVIAQADEDKQQNVKVVSSMDANTMNDGSEKHLRKQVMLNSGSLQQLFGQGKKELVFKPPGDKKISNLSVSFQIA